MYLRTGFRGPLASIVLERVDGQRLELGLAEQSALRHVHVVSRAYVARGRIVARGKPTATRRTVRRLGLKAVRTGSHSGCEATLTVRRWIS